MSAIGKIREGTEVLRTGGGATLTPGECNALYELYEEAKRLVDEPPWRPELTELAYCITYAEGRTP